jgi:hypothetical protein
MWLMNVPGIPPELRKQPSKGYWINGKFHKNFQELPEVIRTRWEGAMRSSAEECGCPPASSPRSVNIVIYTAGNLDVSATLQALVLSSILDFFKPPRHIRTNKRANGWRWAQDKLIQSLGLIIDLHAPWCYSTLHIVGVEKLDDEHTEIIIEDMHLPEVDERITLLAQHAIKLDNALRYYVHERQSLQPEMQGQRDADVARLLAEPMPHDLVLASRRLHA